MPVGRPARNLEIPQSLLAHAVEAIECDAEKSFRFDGAADRQLSWSASALLAPLGRANRRQKDRIIGVERTPR